MNKLKSDLELKKNELELRKNNLNNAKRQLDQQNDFVRISEDKVNDIKSDEQDFDKSKKEKAKADKLSNDIDIGILNSQ